MSCPTPSPHPTLRELLQALARLHPAEAARHQAPLESLEKSLAQAQAQLIQEEARRAEVKPDGTRAASWAWWPRATAVANARRALRLLDVDEAVLRERLEDALFLARQCEAQGLRPCASCRGSGEGSCPPPGGSAELSACAACDGRGLVLTARQ